MRDSYFNCHAHTMYSNLRLLDCINRPKDLIDTSIELGLSGVAITDHECLSAHAEINQYAKEISREHPDFKIVLGNEIYLIDKRGPKQRYYHFILLAKDKIGYTALKKMSTTAWDNIYTERGLERVPLEKTELKSIMEDFKGHVIATTACRGGEMSTLAFQKYLLEKDGLPTNQINQQMYEFFLFCRGIFGDDFYLEVAPSMDKEQIAINQMLLRFAKAVNMKITVGNDAHYLLKKDRPIHKAYLNSKNGDREIDSFYAFTYLMDIKEIYTLLSYSFPEEIIDWIVDNSLEIQNKIQNFDLSHKQIIPKVSVHNYPPIEKTEIEDYPTLFKLFKSSNIQERCWVNDCFLGLQDKKKEKDSKYLQRLEIEADIIDYLGKQLEDCLFAYFNTFKHYIDLFWDCGSIVGPGRGSSTGFLSNYLLGITQLDPIRWDIKYWRFLNKERAELPDIDIDLAPSKRQKIFQAIRKERGRYGLVQVATFGSEGTRSSILAACRGYRSEEYPDGISPDDAQYLSSFIPSERGFLWSIQDVLYGNEEKGRKPVQGFVREIQQYPGLIDIIIAIDSLVNKRSVHASGVILYGEDPFATASFMKTGSGDLITCWDLHRSENCGDTKYDFLVTEISDKIIQCYELLKKDNKIPNGMKLREFYNKYLHPEVLDTSNPLIWQHLAAGDILDVFQFNTGVGLAIAKKLKPKTPQEMTSANAMMRLMSEKGKESQQDRYVRIQKQGLRAFEQEMVNAEMDDSTRAIMHKYCDEYWGCCAIQEQTMSLLMKVCGFTLGEANSARKIISKKLISKIPELKEKVFSCFQNQKAANYFYENIISPQLGYAFSFNHSLPYSFVGIQTIYLAINWSSVYWNCACLIVNSGSLENQTEEKIVSIYGKEDDPDAECIDLPDRSGKIKKTNSTDYSKLARAIGEIRQAGVKLSLVDINKSSLSFKPDAENNRILFGLKGLAKVGDDIIAKIIENRPYASVKDFYKRVKPTKPQMLSLIKGGAFDQMEDRKRVMVWYIWETCDKKANLTIQNMTSLIKYDMLPQSDEFTLALRVYNFNKYLKLHKNPNGFYNIDERSLNFLAEISKEEVVENNVINSKKWDKVYQKYMDTFRNWIAADKQNLLFELNGKIFKEFWDSCASGNYSTWEMEVMCFYYHEHELEHLNSSKYGYANFFVLPEEPIIERTFPKGDSVIKLYKLSKICGTCIAKNKDKSTVALLTTSGVVTVKFNKEFFAMYDKRISERGADGKNHVVESSWFDKGSMIVVNGVRIDDTFICKKYSSTPGHRLMKITSIDRDGNITLQGERYNGGITED